jgi:thiol-disulfide isomerase/thioredoxin
MGRGEEVAPVARVQRRVLIGAVAAALLLAGAGAATLIRAPAPQRADTPPALAGSFADFTVNAAPSPAPEVGFTLDGRPMSLADFRGRVVLVNFWATWCGPCVAEMPSLDRLEAELGGKDFTVLTLSEDRNPAVIAPFYEKHGLRRLKRYHDPSGALSRAFGIRGLPTTVLIDRRGREVGRIEGPAEWDSPAALALIRHFIGQEAGSTQI